MKIQNNPCLTFLQKVYYKDFGKTYSFAQTTRTYMLVFARSFKFHFFRAIPMILLYTGEIHALVKNQTQ